MERTEDGLKKAIDLIRGLRDEFWRNVKVLGTGEGLNQSLEKAGRVADFFELGELMCIDALQPARVLRRPLPRRVPDRGRRGAAPRRPVRLRGGLGVGRRGEPRHDHADPAQGRARLRVRRDEAAELQVTCTSLSRSGGSPTPTTEGADPHLRGRRHHRGHVLPRDARRAQRAADRRRRGAGRLRQRLPRGHLRHVRADDQRRGPRPRGHHDVPAAHALVHRRRHDHHRAVARRPVPGAQGPRASTGARSTGSSPAAATSR